MKKFSFIVLIGSLLMMQSCDKSERKDHDMKIQQTLGGKADGLVSETEQKNEPASAGKVYADEEVADNKTSDQSKQTITSDGRSVQKTDAKIIKTGSISMEVTNYKADRAKLIALVNQQGGYVSGENESNDMNMIQNIISIRVPNEKYDGLINGVEGIAKKVDSKVINLSDVTAEYVDIQARLKAKRDVEMQYMEIMKKAYRVEDMLDVQEQLGNVRAEIESMEGQLKYFDDQVSYSTLTLTMYQPSGYEPSQRGFFSDLWHGLKSGWDGFLSLIVGIFTLWPVWIALALFIFGMIKLIKRLNRK